MSKAGESFTIPSGVPAAPDDTAKIWRYLDFTKFIALLEQRSLFFSRVGGFGDPFEGAFPEGQTVLERLKSFLPEGETVPDSQISFSPELASVWLTMRSWAVINCWHVSEYESAAMWRLYSANDCAIAIQATVGSLREALGTPPPIQPGFFGGTDYCIGAVEYLDYSSDRIPPGGFAAPLFRKRRSFEHERELRAVLIRYPVTSDAVDQDRQPTDPGLLIPVELDTLIKGIRIAPAAPGWLADVAQRVAKRYDLACVPQQSEMDALPLY